MRSITWSVHRRYPKPHVTILWPQIDYLLYKFYGATMTIKVSLYWNIAMLKQFLAAKKTKCSQNRSPKWRFFCKCKGLNIKYCHRDPKRHFLTRNDVIWRILRKYPFRGVGCSVVEAPPKTNKKLTHPRGVFGEQKPLNRSLPNFACWVLSRT